VDPEPKEHAMPDIENLLNEMSLEEQVALLSGADFWSVAGNERLGTGWLRVTDGPNGARGGGSLVGGVKSAAFPVGIALGATWDPDLTRPRK
jgi:beta-glucosidase